MNTQYIQLLVVILFIGASGIAWVFRKVGEQAQKRAVQLELERRRMEALRTGRDPLPLEPGQMSGSIEAAQERTTTPTAMDIAQRRKRQLEELRRRQQLANARRAAGGSPSPGPQARTADPPRMPSTIPGSSGPTVPMPQRRPGVQPASVQEARKQAIQRQQERARRRQDEQVAQQAAEARLRAQRQAEQARSQQPDDASITAAYAIETPATRAAVAKASAAAGDRSARTLIAGKGLTARECRRAIVLNEILSPPIALRE